MRLPRADEPSHSQRSRLPATRAASHVRGANPAASEKDQAGAHDLRGARGRRELGRRKIGGKPFSVYGDNGIAMFNATIGGRRIRETLGVPYSEDKRAAREIETLAARRYAELAAGRVAKPEGRVRTGDSMADLLGAWILDVEKLYPSSLRMFETHARRFAEFTRSVATIFSDEGPRQYAMNRLKDVTRGTVRKELSSLFAFYDWAKTNEHITSVPPRPELPRGMAGKRSGTHRAAPVVVTNDEALRIVRALPEWAARGGGTKPAKAVAGAFRVRDFFELLYETGLRPGTIARLEVPKHWKPGQRTLTITRDIDKVRYAREVPLSARAIAVLQKCAPERGLVFGQHDYRSHYKAAAVAVLGEERGRDFAPYDLRHERITIVLAASQDLLGTAYLAGHKQITTTNRYLHAAQEQAAHAVAATEKLVRNSSGRQKRSSKANSRKRRKP